MMVLLLMVVMLMLVLIKSLVELELVMMLMLLVLVRLNVVHHISRRCFGIDFLGNFLVHPNDGLGVDGDVDGVDVDVAPDKIVYGVGVGDGVDVAAVGSLKWCTSHIQKMLQGLICLEISSPTIVCEK